MLMLVMVRLSGTCGGALFSTPSPAVLWYTSQGRVRCRWAIDAPPGEHVEINVTNVNLPYNDNCNTNHLELRDQPLVCQS